MKKVALITGITGQDGAYLAQLLLNKGYEVHGLVRRSSSPSRYRLDQLLGDSPEVSENLKFHTGDLCDTTSLIAMIDAVRPHEVYNLAAMSDVKASFITPEYTAMVNGLGPLRILQAIKQLKLTGHTKFFQASSSELFGNTNDFPQTESTSFEPRNPYGIAKLHAHWSTIQYRKNHAMYACCGIMYNHESRFRSEEFVTRKITKSLCRISLGLQDHLKIGNMDVKRDWGHAKDYVKAMWLMLQQEIPRDFVIASGINTSIRDFIALAGKELGMEILFKGEGLQEVGVLTSLANPEIEISPGHVMVKTDPEYYQPGKDHLVGDPSLANTLLGWRPHYDLKQLIKEMIAYDLELARDQSSRENQSELI